MEKIHFFEVLDGKPYLFIDNEKVHALDPEGNIMELWEPVNMVDEDNQSG